MPGSNQETESEGWRVFATTHWSVVVAAGEGSEQSQSALETLCHAYWYPIYVYVRRKGYGPDDAQDLTQEFFAQLLAKEHVRQADREKGKFRTFLLAVLDHFLAREWTRAHRQKRGGEFQFVSLNEPTPHERYRLELANGDTPEKQFDRQWALAVLKEAMNALEKECRSHDRGVLFREVQFLLSGESDGMAYAEIAGRIKMTEGCFINADIIQYSTTATIEKTGSGVLQLVGNNLHGATTVSAGTLWVDGTQSGQVAVNAGAVLRGSGTVGRILISGASSRIVPGNGPGILTCSNFLERALGSSSLHVELNGTTPGTTHDQINVRGAVNLGGLTLNCSLGFPSSVGDQFVIVRNDGADPVTGTFTALPQGTNLTIGGEVFVISYTGGDGNDVALTRLTTPPKPELFIERIAPASVRLRWTTNAVGYDLQSNTNLGNWQLLTNPLPVRTGIDFVVTNSSTNGSTFYRLQKP